MRLARTIKDMRTHKEINDIWREFLSKIGICAYCGRVVWQNPVMQGRVHGVVMQGVLMKQRAVIQGSVAGSL
jgi:hypothetical protein